MSWTWSQPVSEEIFNKKYQFHRKSIEEVFRDVAIVIAESEKKSIRKKIEDEFYEMMINGRFIPAGRILANAWPNSKMKNYINCYTIGIEDNMTSIYNSLAEDAKISKVGGGVGLDVSPLRPKGTPLSVGGESSGPISFLRIFDASAKIIMTGGSRRCLPEDAWINCRSGMKQIKDVTVGEEVLTSDGYFKVTNKFNQGVQETIVIKTDNGDFECTPNHKMPIFDSCFSYRWKEARDLAQGNKLVYVSEAIEGVKTELPEFNYIRPKHSTTCKNIVIPKLDIEIAWLFGLIHGDGHVAMRSNGGKGIVNIACDPKYPKIIDRAVKALGKFGLQPSVKNKFGKKSITGSKIVTVHSKQLALYLSQFKTPKTDIEIPKVITEGLTSIREAYLAGLFDADGSSRNRSIKAVCTIYPNFAKSIKSLYSSLGIPVKVKLNVSRKTWKNKFLIKISNSISREIFDNTIAKYSSKYWLKTRTRKRKSNYYGKGKFDHSFPMSYFLDLNIRKKDRKANVCTQNKNITFSTLSRVLNKELNLVPVDVLGIESGRYIKTYDLEVADKQEFVSNGFLTHNSAHIALLDVSHPDIEEFITCKQGDKNRALTQFNISVKITDKFMESVEKDLDWDLVFESKTYKTVKAKYLYDLMVKNAYEHNEPGIFNVDIVNKFNNGWWIYEIHECNPCITGDTLIAVADGRNAVSIKQLAEDGVDVPVYCKDDCGKTTIKMMRNPRITGRNKKIVKVNLDDGTFVKCTENHKFMLNDGSYKEARDLQQGDSLVADIKFKATIGELNSKSNSKSSEYWIVSSGSTKKMEHRLIFEFYNEKILKGMVIHHKDFNSLNNAIDNLEIVTKIYHDSVIHDISGDKNPMRRWWNDATEEEKNRYRKNMSEAVSGKRNPMYGKNHSSKSKKKIGIRTKERFEDDKFKEEFSIAVSNGMSEIDLNKGYNKRALRFLEECQSKTDLECILIDSTKVGVKKVCENCNKEFLVKFRYREHAFCSQQCATENTRKHKRHNVKTPINHKVISVEFYGYEDVYNGTVDEFHNLGIIVNTNDKTETGREKHWMIFTRQCGEQPIPKYNVCDLAALVLTAYVVNPFTSEAYFDFNLFERDIPLGIRFLDNVLDASEYPLEKIYAQVQNLRRIGLGFTGLGDMYAMLGTRYGDEKSKHLANEIGKSLRNNSYIASVALAKEKGSFPMCDNEKLLKSHFIKKLPKSIRDEIREHGLRNIALNTIAPTGTTSFSVGQNCSSGVEPIFSLEYTRRIRTKDDPDEYIEQDVFDYAWGLWKNIKDSTMAMLKEGIPDFFVTTADVAPKDSIDIQAIFQEYVDAAISKTLNLPPGTTFEEYKNLFQYAYQSGLKGFTTFNPEGCASIDTKIHSEKGLINFSDIANMIKVDINQTGDFDTTDLDILVYDKNRELQKVNKLFLMGFSNNTYKINLDSGKSLLLSPNHKIMVKGKWKKVKNLSIGDDIDVYKRKIN